MYRTDKTFDGNSLLPLWTRLDQWETRVKQADEVFKHSVVLTDRRLETSHRAGQRAYITAASLLGVAREHQYLLAKTMVGPHAAGVFPHATLNLVRPAFESALTAFWILDAQSSRERILRALRQAWEDQRQANAWADELLASPTVDDQVRQQALVSRNKVVRRYHEDASHFGLSWKLVSQRVNLRQEIGRLSTLEGDVTLCQTLRAAWRQLSGVQHGLQYATLRSGELLRQVPIPGGSEMVLVADDDWLLTACRVSALAQVWAMSTYLRRTESLTQ